MCVCSSIRGSTAKTAGPIVLKFSGVVDPSGGTMIGLVRARSDMWGVLHVRQKGVRSKSGLSSLQPKWLGVYKRDFEGSWVQCRDTCFCMNGLVGMCRGVTRHVHLFLR